MNTAKEWAAAICITVLVVALLQYFMPKQNMARAFRLLLALFAVLCLLSPTAQLLQSDFSAELESYREQASGTAFSEFTNQQLQEAIELNLRSVVAVELNKIGANYKNLSVITDTDADGRIIMNRILVTLPPAQADKRAAAQQQLEAALGIQTEVTIDDTEE